ncbi:hypothetical protein CK203_019771 [Vitis vinifera]|uniref:Aspartic peptidase DDI1-type domain-containing protein n=1 Tax=Vitis vinifera TaxID=29760 RepID=A0A438JQH8_VITVI|nr:hypothetical protein CK203_019771 [Vitis vinifera]
MREVKAVITIRSGKEVDLPTPKLEQEPKQEPEFEVEKEKREENKGKKKGSSTKKEDLEAKHDQASSDLYKIHEGLVHYQKRLNVSKKAFLTEQVSSIIQCKSPVKYKDPSCPTISMMIGETCVEKALLDLGASVNLLPYSIYKQLGLGKLKPTSITLSLADRSMKIPRGMIEDVLVQVDKNGVMQLTFGNMTLELNIFYMCNKQFHLGEEEGPEEVWLPEPLDLLAILPPLKMMEEILSLFNEEETPETVKEEPPKLI